MALVVGRALLKSAGCNAPPCVRTGNLGLRIR